ncbi:MAG: hypothetical protein AUJ98_06515 [Bacteroidetes bacterium CG2_30_33_31]|nr:MAG: hypothetical protein AUJ98_06515 [Bacteroidetes bacterium CG2_30_33_31]
MPDRKIPQKHSNKIDMEAGTYWYCQCGESSDHPFCDGSHKGSGYSPLLVEIKEPTKVSWCGCVHSKNPPFCDHTHRDL